MGVLKAFGYTAQSVSLLSLLPYTCVQPASLVSCRRNNALKKATVTKRVRHRSHPAQSLHLPRTGLVTLPCTISSDAVRRQTINHHAYTNVAACTQPATTQPMTHLHWARTVSERESRKAPLP
ncbi:hypothetical protein N7G274_000183 [Stereocaulon virgatum]|uniref:Secreted protein n=1 Tax=Stereocaulon virgatum TaxID=373712 RepID=A0ABR4ATU6_9LECA